MSTVMIQCPHTGQPISTCIETDEYSFNHLPEDTPVRARCPLCGGEHTWRKSDAWLEVKEEQPRTAKVA
jgi:hypothetical protein